MEQQEILKLLEFFPEKVVRRDLTKKIREDANVPVYVLECLLGMYASSLDETLVEKGMENIKNILARNYVRPGKAEKVKAKICELGGYTVIDKVTVHLNEKKDCYEAEFSDPGLENVQTSEEYPEEFDRLLDGGIWCIVLMEYWHDENDRWNSPSIAKKVDPIQMPGLDIEAYKMARKEFITNEWIDLLLRSIGMESIQFNKRVKWLHLVRLISLTENNFNLCELGPHGTGKSYVYKEISLNSILVSGGQTTVVNLFYNMASRTMGSVGMWDYAAFSGVAGVKFKDNDGVQIMKDYMASGSFVRGKEEKDASASMAFVGNISQSVDVILKTSNLFEPFPEVMGMDLAFLDWMHCCLPGWEIPKYRPDFFINDYGLITDYFSEAIRELQKVSFGDSFDGYFRLGSRLNQRDTIAVRRIASGMMKLLYPDGGFEKGDVEGILRFALEMRRRVKEQLKKIGGVKFYDVNFSYIDLGGGRKEYVSAPEQGGGTLAPGGLGKPGHLYTVSYGKTGQLGTYRLETQMTSGDGKFERTGINSDAGVREAIDSAYRYLRVNYGSVSQSISLTTKDSVVHVQDMNGIGMTKTLSLSTIIASCSVSLNKPVLPSLIILGDIIIGGSMTKVDNLANCLRVAKDAGAKKVLMPIISAADVGAVPPELVGTFNLIFYQTPEDAVFKALGVE